MAGFFPTNSVQDQILWLKKQLLCVKDCCEGNVEAITIINNTLISIENGMITYVTDLTDAEILALSGVDIQTFYQSTDTNTMYYVNQAGDPVVFHPDDLDISYFERRATIEFISEGITDVAGSYDDFRDTDLAAISRDYMNMPSIIQHNQTGLIYSIFRAGTNHSFFNDSYIIMRVSHDGGETWTDLANTAGTGNYDIILDGSGVGGWDANAIIVTPSGRLVIFTRYFNAGNTYVENQTYYSDDGGATWTQSPTPWALNSLGYVYGNETVEIPNGGILISYRDIQADRYIRVAESFDDGLTWTVRSTMLDNSDRGWNFGETVLQDYGGGRIVALTRFSSDNDDSEHYPFICVSHDYGLTWAGDHETLSFDDIQNGRYGSGFLKLEGVGVSLGGPIANTSCLPYCQRADYLGKQYMVIVYHIRELPNTGQLKVTIIDLDRWLTLGQDAIDPTLPVFILATSPEGLVYDVEGNHSFIVSGKYNFNRLIGITSAASGGSSSGPQQIHYYNYKGVKALIDTYEGIVAPLADNLGNHIMTQNLETSGFWICNDGDNEGIYVETNGDIGFGQGTPTEAVHLGAGKNILLDQGNLTLDDGQVSVTGSNTSVADYNLVDLTFTVAPSAAQSIIDENKILNSALTTSGANTIGVLRNYSNLTTLGHTGSVLGYNGVEQILYPTGVGSLLGQSSNFISDMYLEFAPIGWSAQVLNGFRSYMRFGAEGTIADANGLIVEMIHGIAGGFTGQNITGLRITNVDAGLSSGSWQNRYGILIEDTINDIGVAFEDFTIKSLNTKDSQFAGLLKYASDLSGSYDNRTLVDKEYVDTLGGSVASLYNISGALGVNTTLPDGGFDLNFTGTGNRAHTSATFVNTTTGASNSAVGTFGTTGAWKWGAGGFTDSVNAGFNIVNEETGITENVMSFLNSGASSIFNVKTTRLADNYINQITVNTSFITLSSDDGTNSASLIVDGLISPRIAGAITDGTDSGQFYVKPLEALLESKTATLAAKIGGELRLATEFIANSDPNLAVGQVLKVKNIVTGEAEWEAESTALTVQAEQTLDFVAVAGNLYPINTSAVGAVVADPPVTPTAGDVFAVVDSRENAATNSITIDFIAGGDNHYATSQNAILVTDGIYKEFEYINATIGWIAK